MVRKIKTKEKSKPEKIARYFEGVGRRKTAVARIRIFAGSKNLEVSVNGKDAIKYFPLKKHQDITFAPFRAVSGENFKTSVKVAGGGINAQAEAIRLGVARALVLFNPDWRPTLRSFGYLTRDSRKVERKKPGLRKARRPQQWRKR